MKTEDKFHQIINQFPEHVLRDLLKKLLKGRHKAYGVYINGSGIIVKRSLLRDYLQHKLSNKKE